jgi:hypothetical protein
MHFALLLAVLLHITVLHNLAGSGVERIHDTQSTVRNEDLMGLDFVDAFCFIVSSFTTVLQKLRQSERSIRGSSFVYLFAVLVRRRIVSHHPSRSEFVLCMW